MHPEKHTLIHKLEPFIGELYESVTPQWHDAVHSDASFQDVVVLFEEYLNVLQHDSGTLTSFSMSHIDIVSILLQLLRTSRDKMGYTFVYNP